MKKLVAILLGLIVAASAAEARTYYVDGSRPNNDGNGLRPATAKKTIQAAVDIAQNGDTILVYPGWYAPIRTDNKKIAVKSVKGASKTGITRPVNSAWYVLAALGDGKNTRLTGFKLDGRNVGGGAATGGAEGGTLLSCCLQRIYTSNGALVRHATLTGCTIRNNPGCSPTIENAILARCKITGNSYCEILESRLCNCLVNGNRGLGFGSSVLANCTVTGNRMSEWADGLAYSCRFYNCILRNNYEADRAVLHNVDAGNAYYRTYKNNRNPKFANAAKGNYRLQKGSPCINQGGLNATLKKLVGSFDLSGRKRVRGKAIDMGCYEY